MKHVIACITLFLCCTWAVAQSTDALTGSKLGAKETEELREILKTPAPLGGLKTQIDAHFRRLDAAAFRLGDMQERERVLREWSEVSEDIDARWTYASFLLNSEKINEGFIQFEALIKDVKGLEAGVRARARLAISYIDQSNLKRAEQLLDEASEIIKKFPASRAGVGAYWLTRAEMEFNNIRGRLLLRKGRFEEALESSRLANVKGIELQKYEGLTDARQRYFSRSTHAWVLTETAMIYLAMGKLFDADDALRQAYALFKQYDLTEDTMIDFYRRVGDLRFNEGRYDDAIKVYEMVSGIQQRQGLSPLSAQVFFTRNGINRSLVAQKKWRDALSKYDEMDVYAQGNIRLQNISRQVEARALTYLFTGRVLQAQRLMRGTMTWHTDNFGANHYYTSIMRGILAMTLAASSSPADRQNARAEFEQAVHDMTMPHTLSVDYQENPYRQELKQLILQSYLRLLAESNLDVGNTGVEAFKTANHLIASSVQQAIAEAAARSGIKQPELAAIVRSDQDAKNELTNLYSYISSQASEGENRRNSEIVKAMRTRISELENTRKKIKQQIQQQSPEYFQLLQPKAPTPEDIASRLEPNELFVSILPLEQETLVFALAKDGKLVFHRSTLNQTEIAQLVREIRLTLDVADKGTRAPAFNFTAAYKLYSDLFKPLESVMPGKDHLVIAASGTLGQLPFAVLPTQPFGPTKASAPPWLIHQFAISHIPSANAWISLKRLAQTPSEVQPLMAWGDPLFNTQQSSASGSAQASTVRAMVSERRQVSIDIGQSKVDVIRYAELPPLPETREEVLALARTLGANPQKDVILGREATRESVIQADREGRLGKKQIIVFATHGLLPGDLPRLEQPALAMAASDQKDASPLLTLEDVLGLKLNADWVVLSACNTAGADGRVEEALSGLARGFFYAGSRSLLVTHWSVESESAMQLTTHTFEAYKSSHRMTRAQALRTAMLKVMQQPDYAHPAFWAPYALVGEGSR
jgi:CHAT domain-containing protein